MDTFWYRLTQVQLENGRQNGERRDRVFEEHEDPSEAIWEDDQSTNDNLSPAVVML